MRYVASLIALILVVASPVLAQDEAIDARWSDGAREAIESPGEQLDRAVYAELRQTWGAVATPAIEAVCGEGAPIRSTVTLARTDDGEAYLKFIARGRSNERVRVPAYEDARARTMPASKATIAIYLNRPDVLRAREDRLETGDREVMSVGDMNGVQVTRGDAHHASGALAQDDRYIEVELASTDDAVDLDGAVQALVNAIGAHRLDHFPRTLSIDPIQPTIKEDARDIKQAAKVAGPSKTAIGGDPDDKEVLVKMSTSHGDILLALNETKAPLSTRNFLQYVDAGYYDGLIFHRVMSNFMIQGGGFNKDRQPQETRDPIPNEWENGLKNVAGSLAMARTPNPNSRTTSQFYINVVDNRSKLDVARDGDAYAVFGRVAHGMDTVESIRQVPVEFVNRQFQHLPMVDVVINSVTRFEGEVPAPRPTATGKPVVPMPRDRDRPRDTGADHLPRKGGPDKDE